VEGEEVGALAVLPAVAQLALVDEGDGEEDVESVWVLGVRFGQAPIFSERT